MLMKKKNNVREQAIKDIEHGLIKPKPTLT